MLVSPRRGAQRIVSDWRKEGRAKGAEKLRKGRIVRSLAVHGRKHGFWLRERECLGASHAGVGHAELCDFPKGSSGCCVKDGVQGHMGAGRPSHTGALQARPQVAVEVIQAVILSLFGESGGDSPALRPC